jgi:ketosteroid isomerase-like protein
VSQPDFDAAIEAYHEALQAFVGGNPGPVTSLFSRREDVTLANPLGPPHRGPASVETAIAEASANFAGGSATFEEVSRYATPDLGYVVELERIEGRLVGTEDLRPMGLRVTMVFRREDDAWKVAHRHADPITTTRPITTTIQT